MLRIESGVPGYPPRTRVEKVCIIRNIPPLLVLLSWVGVGSPTIIRVGHVGGAGLHPWVGVGVGGSNRPG